MKAYLIGALGDGNVKQKFVIDLIEILKLTILYY